MIRRVRHIGEKIVFEVELKDVKNKPVNIQDGLILYVEKPRNLGTDGPFTFVLEAKGHYRYTYVPEHEGTYVYRVQNTTSPVTVVHEGDFAIRRFELSGFEFADFPDDPVDPPTDPDSVVGTATTPSFTYTAINACGPFLIGTVMGQEDIYRETSPGSETRVNNTLTARIVWATDIPASSRVYYGIDPALDQDTGIVATGNTFHEVFIEGLNLDSLYRFKVESVSDDCSVTITSELYWFSTGGVVEFIFDQFGFEIGLTLFELSTEISIELGDMFETEVDSDVETNNVANQFSYVLDASANSINATHGESIGDAQLFTSYTVTVT